MTLDLARALDTRGHRPTEPAVVSLAWVTASTATTITAQLADGTVVTAPKVRAYTNPAVNDVVVLVRSGAALYCLGALNAGPVPPTGETGETEPPRDEYATQTFRPLTTGTWQGAGWRPDTTNALQGAMGGEPANYGAAYYGAGPSSLGDDVEDVTATVRVRRTGGGTAAPLAATLRLLAEKTRPDAAPVSLDTLAAPALRVGEDTTVALPATWVDSLLTGAAGGIGTGIPGADPYLALSGSSSWAAAFELTLRWRT